MSDKIDASVSQAKVTENKTSLTTQDDKMD